MTLLQINASIFSNHGHSTRLADEFVAAWRASTPGAQVVVRNLAEDTVPHLDAERFGAFLAKPGERSVEQQAVVDYSDALIDELKRADVLVWDCRCTTSGCRRPSRRTSTTSPAPVQP